MTPESRRIMANALLNTQIPITGGFNAQGLFGALGNVATKYLAAQQLGMADKAEKANNLEKTMVLNKAIRARTGFTNPDDYITQYKQLSPRQEMAGVPRAQIMSTPRDALGQKIPSVPGSKQAMADVLLGAGAKYPDLMEMGLNLSNKLYESQEKAKARQQERMLKLTDLAEELSLKNRLNLERTKIQQARQYVYDHNRLLVSLGKPPLPMPSDQDLLNFNPPPVDIPKLKAEQTQKTATEKMVGKERGKAQFNLPTVLSNAKYLTDLVGSLEDHPGMSDVVGIKGGGAILTNLPFINESIGLGTDADNFNVLLKQIGGKQFLNAYESLKGGGQITEVEGQKAAEAQARLSSAQSEQEFITAAKEYQREIAKLVEIAKKKAGMAPSVGKRPASVSQDVWDAMTPAQKALF